MFSLSSYCLLTFSFSFWALSAIVVSLYATDFLRRGWTTLVNKCTHHAPSRSEQLQLVAAHNDIDLFSPAILVILICEKTTHIYLPLVRTSS